MARTLIVDTGPLYAAAATRDINHSRCVELLAQAPQPLLVPGLVVTEVSYMLHDRIGAHAVGAADYHGEVQVLGPEGGAKGTAKIVTWSPNHVVVDVEGADPGSLLVYNMNFDDGWRSDAGPVVSYHDALAVPLPLPLDITAAVIAGGCVEVYSVNWATALQQEIPPEKLSRVSAYDALGSYALTPVGTALAGPLAAAFGTAVVLTAGGALIAILPFLVLLVPDVRHMRRATTSSAYVDVKNSSA